MSRHYYYGSGNLHVSDTEGVKLLVKQISDEQGDFEMAHGDEDDLYEAVLRKLLKVTQKHAQWPLRRLKRN